MKLAQTWDDRLTSDKLGAVSSTTPAVSAAASIARTLEDVDASPVFYSRTTTSRLFFRGELALQRQGNNAGAPKGSLLLLKGALLISEGACTASWRASMAKKKGVQKRGKSGAPLVAASAVWKSMKKPYGKQCTVYEV